MSNSFLHKKYKFAIIGCGRIADRHAAIMQKLGEIIAVCDIIFHQSLKYVTEGTKDICKCYFCIQPRELIRLLND